MISDLDYIRNDVADLKVDLRQIAAVAAQAENQQYQSLSVLLEVQKLVEAIDSRLASMEQKFIDMNVIYPDLT